MLVTPLVVLAGLGELGRGSWAIHPVLGGRFKASVVSTDLPLRPDKPIDFGLQKFCRVCKRCAEACPSRSIPESDLLVEVNGHLAYDCDLERCTKYRVMNQNGVSCGTCVKVCPWTKPEGWTHDLVRWAIRKTPAFDAAWVKLDRLWGYGKQDLDYKWWFDLEEDNGTHRIPPRSRDNGLWAIEEPPAPSPQMPHGSDAHGKASGR
jgi:reductive dehalogenase